MAYRVLIPQDIAEEGKAYLREHGFEIKAGSGSTEQDTMRDVADCDAVLLRTAAMTRNVMEAGRRLRMIARHGAGYNNVDLAVADELGILVTNTPDATTESVAEYTIGAVLMMAKRMEECRSHLKQGDFYYKNSHKGMDLRGKTLGIVGIGRIGCAVAKKAFYGLDMQVTAYSPRKKQEELPDYVRLVPWEELFAGADVVSVHVPLTGETRGFIGARELGLMKREAYLINASRGGVVEETALLDALKNGKIAGLFTDVMDQEPPAADHPFFSMENVIVMPHMASNTEECMARMALQSAQEIVREFSGEGARWVVNQKRRDNGI